MKMSLKPILEMILKPILKPITAEKINYETLLKNQKIDEHI